ATWYTTSSLNTPDVDDFSPRLPVGAVAPDGPVTQDGHTVWWLSQLGGPFTIAIFCVEALPEAPKLNQMAGLGFQLIPVRCILVVPPALEGDIAPGIEYV